MDNKSKARLEMLAKLSKDKSSEMPEGFGDKLRGKKLEKVEVIAEDKKGLEKGLSKAQQILKAKFGEDVVSDEDESVEDGDCEVCPHCGAKKEESESAEDYIPEID